MTSSPRVAIARARSMTVTPRPLRSARSPGAAPKQPVGEVGERGGVDMGEGVAEHPPVGHDQHAADVEADRLERRKLRHRSMLARVRPTTGIGRS